MGDHGNETAFQFAQFLLPRQFQAIVEAVDGDCRFFVGRARIGLTVRIDRRRAGQHFVQCDSGGVALGVEIPARRLAIR